MNSHTKKVFIGGSRRLTRLNHDVIAQLDRIIESRLHILIGDANGADKAVQRYLCERNYPNVTVFHSGSKWRNNVGGWSAEQVEPPTKQRGYNYYAAKDKRMADEANYGFAIWDGKSRGTLEQIKRLRSQDKKVRVYATNMKRLMDPSDLEALMKDKPDSERTPLLSMAEPPASSLPEKQASLNL